MEVMQSAVLEDRVTLTATPTDDDLPRRFADFATLGDALDYAARGVRGLNFHDARGSLVRVLADWQFDNAPVILLVPTRKGRTARVQALIEFLEASFGGSSARLSKK